ncbi:DNA-binding transcriptional MerR regulator [Kribbella voronezhensis]|uniref:DNA-binding transcriptional MerR regulator n=1 Tax=Kribbella voronezhensis TaxID=2512212 RepID=A0A4V3FIQ0_9ACTN|nr:MerR family DNA-binding transcriptional regulator [Kribbella voronezhensis]TDU83213.1 DNA-binding transcriptional MerR regulator [Kribbella voronezhensis]
MAKPSSGTSSTIRGVMLAREAGISVQQVRNYEQAGLLPATTRSAAGYREFDEQHRQALVAARALVAAYGWEDAVTIMAAVHRDDLKTAVARVDHAHAELDSERRRIQQALHAFEVVVTHPLDADPRMKAALDQMDRQGASLRVGQLADLLGVRTSTLRFWESAGLVRPTRDRATGYRVYDRASARDAHLVRLLREGNFPTAIIRAALTEMHSSADGRPERVGAELSRRDLQLDERSLRRLRADAALVAYLDWRNGRSDLRG